MAAEKETTKRRRRRTEAPQDSEKNETQTNPEINPDETKSPEEQFDAEQSEALDQIAENADLSDAEMVDTLLNSPEETSEAVSMDDAKLLESVEDGMKTAPLPKINEETSPEVKKQAVRKEKEKALDQISKSVSDADLLSMKGRKSASKSEKTAMYTEGNAVIPLHDKLQYTTEGEINKQAYLDLAHSRTNRIALYGTISSTTIKAGQVCAVLHRGDFSILIPWQRFITPSEEAKLNEEEDKNERQLMLRRFTNSRIGSEIDYIVIGIDEVERVAIADRRAAMEIKKQVYYLSTNGLGQYALNEGTKVEARVVVASPAQLTVEAYGMEFKLREKDIAYTHIPDVSKEYPVGTTMPIIFTKLERQKKDNIIEIRASVSHRDAMSDPRKRYFNLYEEDSFITGVVTGLTEDGIYVRLEGMHGKQDMMCSFKTKELPGRPIELPKIGDNVLCKVLKKEEFDNHDRPVYRIFGIIIRNLSR